MFTSKVVESGLNNSLFTKSVFLMLLNSGSDAHHLEANTQEMNAAWKGKVALFRGQQS